MRDGMGALPHDTGTTFRVWAPHADSVSVVGDFNDWDAARHPMERDDAGNWATDVEGAEPGHEYKYVITNGDAEFQRIDPYAQEVTNSVGNGVIHDHGRYDWEGDEFHCPPHNELVIYEAHVGSFKPDGDGVGTFADVEAALDHLVNLGVNALQLMPVMEFAGDYSWGYNPAHIHAVESAYGGPNGLKDLVKAAHRKGLAVIVDVVYNHFGPSDLDLWQFDGWSENDKGGIYFYQDDRSSTPWGDTRPDYGRTEVRNYIRDNALMWLREYRLDGLRLDMTPYMRSTHASGFDIEEGWTLQRWLTDTVRAEHPDVIMIAEDLHGEPRVTSQEPDGAGYHAQWDAHFVHPVRAVATASHDEDRSMQAVADAVSFSYGDAFARVIYTESHDEVANGKARVPQEADESNPQGYFAQKLSTMGAALMFTAPGIPMLFQGQEFLQGEYFRDDVPLDWHLNESFQGIAALYRDLIRLRRNLDGRTRGLQGQHVHVFHADEERNVVAFHRWNDGGPGDDVVVVVNVSAQPHEKISIGMPHAGTWELVLNSDNRAYSPDFGDTSSWSEQVSPESSDEDGLSQSMEITIGPYTTLVYARRD